jgi:hypothetical protein
VQGLGAGLQVQMQRLVMQQRLRAT